LVESFSNGDGAISGPGIDHRLGARQRLGKREWALDESSANPVTALLDRQIKIKFWASAWMVLEVLALVVFGVVLMLLAEPWDLIVW